MISRPMFDTCFTQNRRLANHLTQLVQSKRAAALPVLSGLAEIVSDATIPLHIVVTANEINDLHGTGPLVKRVCKGWQNVCCIRARDDWGVHDFGDWNFCLSPRPQKRSEFFQSLLRLFRGHKIQTVLCVPFLLDEFLSSIAIHQCFGAELCTWLMDDQNIASRNIPDALMRELLERSSLRLATHPELRFVYEQKYGLPFHLLPAIVPSQIVSAEVKVPLNGSSNRRRGALMGSFWDQTWFDRLCNALSRCDCDIDWFGNNVSPWLKFPLKSLREAGITPHGVIPESRLGDELKKYPFVLVPGGVLNEGETNTSVARLSLPGRILFTLATSGTPVLMVGDERTCGARFIRHFGIGEVVPYDASAISAAMDRLSVPENQTSMRQRAAQIAPVFSDHGVSDWLAASIQLGEPADRRFEDLFAGYPADIKLK